MTKAQCPDADERSRTIAPRDFRAAGPDDGCDLGGVFRSGGDPVGLGGARYLAHQRHARARRLSHLDTHDASSGHMHEEYSALELLKKVFLNPLMLMFAFVELTAGVLRNGIMQWYTIFAHEVKQPGAEIILANWGLLLCVFGIIGGFAGGLISDKFFQSRRGPPAAIFCAFMLMMAAVMAMNLFSLPFVVGVAALFIVAAVTGVHSLMSGTAAADFGGRKATATARGSSMASFISEAACNRSASAISSLITAGNGGRYSSCRLPSSAD